MLSKGSIEQISHIFCGDISGYYSYKTGGQLVEFFNQYYKATDRYQSGFPSRWVYVYDKIVGLINSGKVNSFFDIILSKEFLMRDLSATEVDAAQRSEEILAEFNRIVGQDLCKITHVNGQYYLVKENDDLVLIGSGGFANVYRQKSTGLVVKKLKDDFLTDGGIKSRFKREFNITNEYAAWDGAVRPDPWCSMTAEMVQARRGYGA